MNLEENEHALKKLVKFTAWHRAGITTAAGGALPLGMAIGQG
jgi:hypothetical protein